MSPSLSNEHLETTRNHRQGVNVAMIELERSLARSPELPDWTAGAGIAVAGLQSAFASHVAATEAPDGLLARMLDEAPHLAGHIAEIRDDHRVISQRLSELDVAVADEGSDRVRRLATAVLGRIARHRQHGADLMYDAYNVDIGTGD